MAMLSRILDWFWLSSRARELRAGAARLSSRGEVLARRARVVDAIARQTLAPQEPYTEDRPDAVVCELFRESIHWSLAAQRELESGGEGKHALPSTESENPERFAREVVARSFEDFAELDEREQAELVEKLDQCSRALLESLPSPQREWRSLWLKRAVRIGAPLVIIAIVVTFGARALEDWRDVARGRLWKASSQIPQSTGCKSPEQECDERRFFFHTTEQDSPSIEFDLGETKTISAVVVHNRTDCCADRAIPLVVEVSDRPGEWREVTRRGKEFDSWHGRFPATRARWVRLTVPRKTYFHLARVKILR